MSAAGGWHPAAVTNCPHCDAPLKPAATFCLACDRPVVDETSRLSVAEPVKVSVGRPVVAVAAIVGCLVLLGGSAWGGVAYVRSVHHKSKELVISDVLRGTTLLIDAEGGSSGDCRRVPKALMGAVKDLRQQCDAIVGDDPGAHVQKISVDRLDLTGEVGKAYVHATVSDAKGTRTVDRVVDLHRASRAWRMVWDGKPEV